MGSDDQVRDKSHSLPLQSGRLLGVQEVSLWEVRVGCHARDMKEVND